LKRLPNTLNISIKRIVGEEILSQIPEIAASTGSACHSGSFEASKVLLEMRLSIDEALGALRLTLGRWTREDEVDGASKLITECIKTVTKASPSPMLGVSG
jgi:cysteine desulfurase